MIDGHDMIKKFVQNQLDEVLFSAQLHRSGQTIGDGTARIYFGSDPSRLLVDFYGRLRDGYSVESLDPFRKDEDSMVLVTGSTLSGFDANLSTIVSGIKRGLDDQFSFCFGIIVARFFRTATYSRVAVPPISFFFAEIEKAAIGSDYPPAISENTITVEIDGSTVQIAKGTPNTNLVVVSNPSKVQCHQLLRKTTDALSLLFGNHCDHLATYSCFEHLEELALHPEYLGRSRGSTRWFPIQHEGDFIGSFLEKCFKSFGHHGTDHLRRFHGYIVDTYQADLYSKEMATGIAVAGIAEYIIEHLPDNDAQARKLAQKKYLEFVKEVRRSISGLKAAPELEARAIEELNGRFENAKSRMRRAAKLVNVDLDEDDLKLWIEMRNQAAHPDFKKVPFAVRNMRLEASKRIFMQLLLGYIG